MEQPVDYTVRDYLLSTLKILDINGWCCATDGSMDDIPVEEQNCLLSRTIADLLETL